MKIFQKKPNNTSFQNPKPFFEKRENERNSLQNDYFFKNTIQKKESTERQSTSTKPVDRQNDENKDKCSKQVESYVNNNWIFELQNKLIEINSTDIELFRSIANEVIGRIEYQSFGDANDGIGCCFKYVGVVTGIKDNPTQKNYDSFLRNPDPIPDSDTTVGETISPSKDGKYFITVYAIKQLPIEECIMA